MLKARLHLIGLLLDMSLFLLTTNEHNAMLNTTIGENIWQQET